MRLIKFNHSFIRADKIVSVLQAQEDGFFLEIRFQQSETVLHIYFETEEKRIEKYNEIISILEAL